MFSLIADDEMFVDVEGLEGRYSVSNYGRVYSHFGKGRFLKPYPNNDGYLRVSLQKDGNKSHRIHILVGNAFIGKREGELTFDHYPDRNKQNNKASNIRLATKSEQVINQKTRCTNKLGEKNICIYIDKRNGNVFYHIKITRKGKGVFQKRLNVEKYNLEDAVKLRDDFLKNE